VLPFMMLEVLQYTTTEGRIPFEIWYGSLDRQAAQKVSTALAKMESGNLGDVKAVGSGVNETKVHFGPGYRIYFGRDGEKLIILLGGGTKQRQQRDIDHAIVRWQDYKKQKRSENDAFN
jgi:putative addiction module killer protein